MASITVLLSDSARNWIEEQVRGGGYASVGDYLSDLVMRERVRQGEELSLEDVRQIVKTSRASGIGTQTMDELFGEAQRLIDVQKAGRA